MKPHWRTEAALVARYALSGVANTIVGLSVIYAFTWASVSPYLANALGYAAGLVFAYFNSRSFVFRFTGTHRSTALRYLSAFAVSYSLNMAVLAWALHQLTWSAWLAQAAGVVTHAAVMFVLSRCFVFARRPHPTD
jgi:putative flippase GtrA